MPLPLLRNKPLWIRLLVAFLIGIVIMVTIQVISSNNSAARADDASVFAGMEARGSIDMNTGVCEHAKGPGCRNIVAGLTSPDARQAIGGAAGACLVGAIVSGWGGCGLGALGALVGAVPYDGTWD